MFPRPFCSHITGLIRLTRLTSRPLRSSFPLAATVRQSPAQREVRARRPASAASPLPQTALIPSKSMPAHWYLQALCHIHQSIDTVAKSSTPKKRDGGTEALRSAAALFIGERSTRARRRTSFRRGKQFGIANIPFDSTLSPSRSSRLSPAPTERQNTALSWISSAWLPTSLWFSRRSASWFRYNSLFDTGGGIRSELRRTDPAGFVSRPGGTEGGSRKQPTNISEVRGQRLADSNPIKHRLRRPRRRAGAGSEHNRARGKEPGKDGSGAVTGGEKPLLISDTSSFLSFLFFKGTTIILLRDSRLMWSRVYPEETLGAPEGLQQWGGSWKNGFMDFSLPCNIHVTNGRHPFSWNVLITFSNVFLFGWGQTIETFNVYMFCRTTKIPHK